MEAKLFTDEEAFVSTFAFHVNRPRAPHWEQDTHRPRLAKAAAYVVAHRDELRSERGVMSPIKVVDLGCGDGGLLAHLWTEYVGTFELRGYDFQPTNLDGWIERGTTAACSATDFVRNWDAVEHDGDVYVMTEVLEHLTDPHAMLRRIAIMGARIVVSSPFTETYESHDECHAWAWDTTGYREMIVAAGFTIQQHETVGMFQVVRARI